MAEEAAMKTQQIWFRVHRGFYIFMMLISMDDIYWVERSAGGRGWDLQFVICLPWVFALMAGLSLLTISKRRKLDKQVIGYLLFLLAFVISSSYSVMGKLAALIR